MRIHKKITVCLSGILCLAMLLTGCSFDGTMFSMMKQSMSLSGFEFTTQIDLDKDDVVHQIIVTGEVDEELEGSMSVIAKVGEKSYDLQDILRIAGGGLYLNAEVLSQAIGLDAASDVNVNKWVKLSDVNMGSSVKKDIAHVYEEIVDKLEEICNGIEIPKQNGTYNLSLTGTDSISFLKELLSMADSDAAEWYKSYLAIKNETGLSQAAIELCDVFWGEDIVNYLSVNNTDSFKESYSAWSQNVQNDLSELGKQVDNGSSNFSIEYSIGKFDEIYKEKMDIENTSSDGTAYKLTVTSEKTKKSDISVEAPADEEVTDSVEGQQVAHSLLTSLINSTSQTEDDGTKTSLLDTSNLTQEQKDALAATLQDNEMYLMNISDGLDSLILTYDHSNLKMENQVAEYYNSVTSSRGSGVECSLFYEKGSMSKDLKEKYKLYQYDSKESNYKEDLKTIETNAGEVSYFTCLNVSEESNLTNVVFGIPIEKGSFISGYLEYSGELDVEAFLDALFKKIEKVK